MNTNQEFLKLKENTNKKFNLSIIFTILILFLYCYFGSYSFFEKYFPNTPNLDYWKIIYHNIMAFVLYFIIGIIYNKFITKEKLKNTNLTTGNYKLGLIIIGIATLIVPLIALTTLLDKEMTSTYPLINFDTYSSLWQILLYFTSYVMYYIGWEFLFRGLLLKGTIEHIGPLSAILITTLISALIHTSIGSFGKPMIETLSAIPAGLIFGYIAHKTNSIYYTLYIHALIGILTDIFIFFI